MARRKVGIDQLGAAVADLLKEYGDECTDIIKEVAPKFAKEAVSELKSASPKKASGRNAGRYARGWKVDTQPTRTGITATAYNATDYQLTHLLENGHVTRNGGRTRAITHIAPINDKIQDEFIKEIERRLSE